MAQGTATASGGGFVSLQQANTAYDTLGRKVRESATAGGTTYALTDYGYDAANRLECVARRMNPAAFGASVAACSLGAQGSFGPDRIVRYGYSAADEVLTVTAGYGVAGQARDEVTNGYAPASGLLETVKDGRGNVTRYVYDGFDRLFQTRYPSKTNVGTSDAADHEQLGYDAASNVIQRRLRDGVTFTFAYDDLGRLVTRTPSSNDEVTTFAYDLLGRLVGANNANLSSKSFGYDALGRKISEGAPRGGMATMGYDAAGRRTRLTWADGFTVTYEYDVTGAMTAIRESGATSGTGVLARYGYDDLGRRVSRTLGNGLVTSYGYDDASRLTGLATSGGGGNAVTLGGYDPAGGLGTRVSSNDGYAWGGAVNASRGYASNGLNQYSQSGAVTPSYDARGNLTNAGGATYAYNARNLLTGFGTGGIYYNPLSQLLDVSTERTWMVYDGAQTIAEIGYDGPLARRYVWGPGADDLVLWYEDAGTSQRRWADLDERGSTTRISNDAGATLWINTYDEYGIPGAGNGGRFQYTGQAWLPSLGLYNYKARIYSPTFGRFLQADPIGYGDGLNMHAYVGNDPVNNTDPSGLQETGPDIIVIGSRPTTTSSGGGGPRSNPGVSGLNENLRESRADTAYARNHPDLSGNPNPPTPQNDIVVTSDCNATCRANLRSQEDSKWVLQDSRFMLNPYYNDPAPWLNLENFIIGPPLIGALAATLPASGPSGLLFGRLRYTNGAPSLFNTGKFRVGWSWNSNGWAGARNYFGVHGGRPGTPSHWHQTPMPGPRGPGW